ncbi:hypothetical protein EDB83DRAFT_2418427, partial [Lactarius deliciosus]
SSMPKNWTRTRTTWRIGRMFQTRPLFLYVSMLHQSRLTVAIFIAISYPNLQQDPNIITQPLLAQISQQCSN